MKRNELLDRPITFHRGFTRHTKSTTASLMLSYACGLPAGEKDADGWFCLTAKDWEGETGLTLYEQQGARKVLRSLYDQDGNQVWQEELREVPSKLFFRVDVDALWNLLSGDEGG